MTTEALTERKLAAEAQMAEARARLAGLRVARAEFELQQAREAVRRPADSGDTDPLRDVGSAQPGAQPDSQPRPGADPPSSPVSFSEKTLLSTRFVYQILPAAVRKLRTAINEAEWQHEEADRCEYRLIYVDETLASTAAEYHTLTTRAQTSFRLYSALSGPPAGASSAPSSAPSVAPAPGAPAGAAEPRSLLGTLGSLPLLGGLQVVSAGLALAQHVADAFKIRKTISSAQTPINVALFHELVKAELHTLGRSGASSFGALQMPGLDWTFTATREASALEGLIQQLARLSEREVFRSSREQASALNAELASLVRQFSELGPEKVATAERLARLLSEKRHLLLYTRLLHASAAIAVTDQSFRAESKIRAHPVLVMSYTVMTGQGVVLASGVCTHSEAVPLTL